MLRQTTLSRLLIVTGLIAVGFAFAPRIYNRANDGLGNAFAVVLLIALLTGAGLGVWADGFRGAVAGALGGLLFFLIGGLLALAVLWAAKVS